MARCSWILRRLREAGPATSTTLARGLGQNSGIMSYHLRLLAEHDFVREAAGRGQGRELFPAALMLSFGLAALSHRVLEQPILSS